MSKSVGLGIIGCGQIAPHHIRNTQDDPRVRWVAACDLRREAVEERADEFGIAGRYTGVEDLLADPAVDAVVVATGPEAHREPTIAAFVAGKHVLVEKPVGVHAEDVEAMLSAQGDLVGACCSSRFRSTVSAHEAARILAAGELGEVRRLSVSASHPPPGGYDGTSPFFLHRAGWGGQGVLADWGCYDLDFMLGLCGWTLEPETVVSNTRRVPEHFRLIAEPRNDVEVAVTAQVRLTGGATLDFHRAMFAAVEEPRGSWRIECEGGALDANMVSGAPQLVVHRYIAGISERHVAVRDAFEWSEIHRGPVIDFVEAILDGRPPMTSLRNALTVQRLTDAIYTSARSGEPVTCAR